MEGWREGLAVLEDRFSYVAFGFKCRNCVGQDDLYNQAVSYVQLGNVKKDYTPRVMCRECRGDMDLVEKWTLINYKTEDAIFEEVFGKTGWCWWPD